MGKSQREKGKRGERELASKLREHGFTNARRSKQYSGEGDDSADVIKALPGVYIECKRVERLNVPDAIKQAVRDSVDGEKGKPGVFHRRNNEPWLVTMRLDDWIDIYREYFSGMEG